MKLFEARNPVHPTPRRPERDTVPPVPGDHVAHGRRRAADLRRDAAAVAAGRDDVPVRRSGTAAVPACWCRSGCPGRRWSTPGLPVAETPYAVAGDQVAGGGRGPTDSEDRAVDAVTPLPAELKGV